jgi:hypothetical protein
MQKKWDDGTFIFYSKKYYNKYFYEVTTVDICIKICKSNGEVYSFYNDIG